MKKISATILSLLLVFSFVDKSQAQIINFSGTLLGSNVVGGGISPAGSGTFTATYTPSTQVLNVSGTYSGMTSNVTNAHVHIGVAGVNGGVAMTLTFTASTSGTINGNSTLSASNVSALINDGLYINVHTANNGSGEIRDQVTLTDALTFGGNLSAANVPIPPASSGEGTFTATYDPPSGVLSVAGDYSDMTSNVTVAHVHDGPVGETGGVVFGLSTTGGTMGTFSGSGFSGQLISDLQLVDLLNEGLYINVHTENNPGSEIRDQLNLTITPLPVELVNFEGISDGSSATLVWTTSSELNNAGFEVQTRTSGDWKALSFVEGSGTSTVNRSYSFEARKLIPGQHRFRLKQIDFDGSIEYSPEIELSVDIPSGFFVSQAYPNPFNPSTSFEIVLAETQGVQIEVFDLLGQRRAFLFEGEVQANEVFPVRFDATAFPSGVYLVRVLGERGHKATRTVTLLK